MEFNPVQWKRRNYTLSGGGQHPRPVGAFTGIFPRLFRQNTYQFSVKRQGDLPFKLSRGGRAGPTGAGEADGKAGAGTVDVPGGIARQSQKAFGVPERLFLWNRPRFCCIMGHRVWGSCGSKHLPFYYRCTTNEGRNTPLFAPFRLEHDIVREFQQPVLLRKYSKSS